MPILNSYKTKIFLKFIILSIVVVLSVYALFKLSLFIAPFVIAFLISSLIEPINLFFMKKLNISRKTATAFSLILVLLFLGTVVTLTVSKFISELFNLSSLMPSYIADIYQSINALMKKSAEIYPVLPEGFTKAVDVIVSNLSIALMQMFDSFIKRILNTAISIPQMMLFILVSILSTYFLSCDRTKINNFIKSQLPANWISKFISVRDDMFSALFGYLRAQLILMLITFLQLYIGFLFIGVKQPLSLAALICLIDALPILGTGSVLLPWSIYEFIMGNFNQGLSIIVVYVVVFMVRQIIEPKLVSQQIGVHPLITLFAMYFGLQLFGVMGMILGPITAIFLKNVFSGVLKNRPIKVFFEKEKPKNFPLG